MTDLETLFRNNKGYMSHKFPHHMAIYDQFFSKFRNKDICVLELGVAHGGSLFIWKEYFGSQAKIYGADSHGYDFKDNQIKTFTGLFSDVEFIRKLKAEIPPIDILIDDGSHDSRDQRLVFEELFPHIKDEGLYVCEDLQTAFSEAWGGGYHKPESWIEHLKNFLDYQYGYYLDDDPICSSEFQHGRIYSMHFYPFLVVIEKSVSSMKKANEGSIHTGELSAI